MRLKHTSGVAVATAAAMLFGTGLIASSVAAADAGTVHCKGVNACKGQSACKGASNSCKGQNSCKGKGFLEMSKEDCAAAKEKMKSDAGK